MSKVFIGIDFGGTNIKIGIFDGDLNVLGKRSVATGAGMGPEAVVEAMVAGVEKVLAEVGGGLSDVAGAGLATPGPAKYKEGILINPTNLPAFHNFPLRDALSKRLGKPLVFENDANVACWGEHAVGAGKGSDEMVFFTLGTGIGGGIINNGKLLSGSGDNAAELGHIIIYPEGRLCNCGQKGCVEAYASASATARRATEAVEGGAESSLKKVLGEKGEITCKDVYDHLALGDDLAKRITDETAEALAVLCINMLHVTEPARIVFAGGMIAAGSVLLDRIKEYFGQLVWGAKEETVEICYATLGEDAGIIGAAALAKDVQVG